MGNSLISGSSPAVFVAGATGRVGKHIVGRLQQDRTAFKAMSRSSVRLDTLSIASGDRVVADLLTMPNVCSALEGTQTVVSLVGIDPVKFTGRKRFRDVDFAANSNLLNAAMSAGVKRFVYLSVFGDGPLENTSYVKAHRDFEQELSGSGLEWVVVRPTGFFSTLLSFRNLARKRGFVPVIGTGSARTNPIHEEDVAETIIRGISTASPGTVANIGGPQIFTRREIAELAFSGLDKKPRIFRSPGLVWTGLKWASRPFAPHTSEVVDFALKVSTNDGIAPAIGTRRLEDYFLLGVLQG